MAKRKDDSRGQPRESQKPPSHAAPRIHASAEVEPGAHLGAGTVVWRHCHVMKGARIGDRVMLGQGCFVGGRVNVGDGCRIQNGVSLYDGVHLEEDVFVGPGAVFTNVKRPRARFPRKPAYEQTTVRAGASIGANATLLPGITVGRSALVGAGAVVTQDVPDYAVVTGCPARVVGAVCPCGDLLVRGSSPRLAVCRRCGGKTGTVRERRERPLP